MTYIAEHGTDEWGKLCSQPVIEAGIKTMDPNMSKADYRALTRSERIAFIREFGDGAVSRIMQKLQ
jgi:hypothetical protein